MIWSDRQDASVNACSPCWSIALRTCSSGKINGSCRICLLPPVMIGTGPLVIEVSNARSPRIEVSFAEACPWVQCAGFNPRSFAPFAPARVASQHVDDVATALQSPHIYLWIMCFRRASLASSCAASRLLLLRDLRLRRLPSQCLAPRSRWMQLKTRWKFDITPRSLEN